MPKEAFQLQDSAVAAYEDQKVRSMFGPLARATLDRVTLGVDDVILDVACGTGIVGRSIYARVKPKAPITGIDLNAGMIEMARHVTRAHDAAFDWRVADITDMPLSSGTFTTVFCQQGIQYFPDEIAALTEMRRVMQIDGQLILSVWGGASDFFEAMASSVTKHIGADIGKKYLAPFAYSRSGLLAGMLQDTGFGDVARETLLVDRTMDDIGANLSKEILGHPAGPIVEAAGPKIISAICRDVLAACKIYMRGEDMIVPQRTHVFTAIAN